jgi:hypothetical protein
MPTSEFLRVERSINQFVRLKFSTQLLNKFLTNLSMNESQAIGLREMEISAYDVAEMRRHIDRPSAFPRIPLRRIPEEDVFDFE